MRSASLRAAAAAPRPRAAAARSSAACRGISGRGVRRLMVVLSAFIGLVMPGFMPGIHAFIHARRQDEVVAMPSFMDMALDEARKAQGAGEVPVGCVIVRDGAVVATRRQPHAGRPRSDRACRNRGDPRRGPAARLRAAHRLRSLCHAGALRDVRGGDLVRAHPAALLRRADPKGGAVEHGPRFYQSPTCHHRPEIYGGIGESEAASCCAASSQRGATKAFSGESLPRT